MDVPYRSSGALSAAHYSLVRKVENAVYEQDVERFLIEEVATLKRKLSNASQAKCREYLIVLLYCLNTSFGAVTCRSLEFAIPTALNLIESGRTNSEKRIGYLFCSEVLPQAHPLQLMLVNSLLKDLSSKQLPRVALAMQTLVSSPSLDVIPAVRPHVIRLMDHPSPGIKRLALHSFRVLASLDPDLYSIPDVTELVLKRFKDGEYDTIQATTCLALELCRTNNLPAKSLADACHLTLKSQAIDYSRSKKNGNSPDMFGRSQLHALSVLISSRPELFSDDTGVANIVELVLLVLRRAVDAACESLVLECFRTLSNIPVHQLTLSLVTMTNLPKPSTDESPQRPRRTHQHPVKQISHLLSAVTSTSQYLFLSCLSLLDASLWAGTELTEPGTLSISAQLDKWEVGRIMSFMASEDGDTRVLTYKVLLKVDKSILENLLTQGCDNISANRSDDSKGVADVDGKVLRLLEILDVYSSVSDTNEGGSLYASKLSDIMTIVENESSVVMGDVLEVVLKKARKESRTFGLGMLRRLLKLAAPTLDPDTNDNFLGQSSKEESITLTPTLIMIFSALICEYASQVGNDKQVDALARLSILLESSSALLQEPVLVAMMCLLILILQSPEIGNSIREFGAGIRKRVEVVKTKASVNTERKKSFARVFKRTLQFEQIWDSWENLPEAHTLLLDGMTSLPALALTFDRLTNVSSPYSEPTPPIKQYSIPSRPTTSLSEGSRNQSSTSISSAPSSINDRLKRGLRYEAYDPPPVSSLRSSSRMRRYQRSERSYSSLSTRSASATSSRSRGAGHHREERLNDNLDRTITMTAGDLALTGGRVRAAAEESNSNSTAGRNVREKVNAVRQTVGNTKYSSVATADLLALESPFLSEPTDPFNTITAPDSITTTRSQSISPDAGSNSLSFQEIWDSLALEEGVSGSVESDSESSGFFRGSMDDAVRRLQRLHGLGTGMSMSVTDASTLPFIGELKILFYSLPNELLENTEAVRRSAGATNATAVAAVRLKEYPIDESSNSVSLCSWRLRSTDDVLRAALKGVLEY